MPKIIYKLNDLTGQLERLEPDAGEAFEAAVQEIEAKPTSHNIQSMATDVDHITAFAKGLLPEKIRNELDAVSTLIKSLEVRPDHKGAAVHEALKTLYGEYDAIWASQEGRLAQRVAIDVCFFGRNEAEATKKRLMKKARGTPYQRPALA